MTSATVAVVEETVQKHHNSNHKCFKSIFLLNIYLTILNWPYRKKLIFNLFTVLRND